MPISITMPALSPTMTEGKLAKWNVKEGDEITAGMVLAEIETDKATMEVEAVDEGKLGKILVAEGTEGVAVNTPIALILSEGEDAKALQGFTPKAPKTAAAPAPAPKAAPAPPPAAPQRPTASAAPPLQVAAAAARPDGARVFISPLAKRLAAQAGLDIRAIQGSGPHGRIVKVDVDAAAARGGMPRAPQAPATTLPAGEGFIEVPLSMMRKTIARRLTESKQTIPHFYLSIDCELGALVELRQKINTKQDAYKLSVNDFLIKACGLALKKVPTANSIWGGDKLLQSRTCDVAVAVALDGGLITPIVRNVDQRGLPSISADMKELAERAKKGKLRPEEYQGGTFAISNLGMYGIKDFAAVINPPHGSILAVGVGEQRPVAKNGQLAIATVMSCTMACDHRVIDGALGAKWLAAFKALVEDPLLLLL
ncbi:MAG TPA: pyruvate dehydrogenase complex dihydrolipoamide acetyltransferase [Candidatus Cybelea sp.]|nr:pyruvate dehydrogenase complex dihydrolipoamide acetyltransferase [Candidatus Cybelea sp.]